MEFLNVIILLGALQGFIISGLLFFGKAKSLSHRILAFLILIISLACLNLYLLEIGLPGKSSFWSDISIVIPLVLAMPIGPLIYFYVHALLVPGFSFAKRDRLHFYPILLDLLPRFIGVVYLVTQSANWLTGDQRIMLVRVMDLSDMYLDIPRWISVTVYTMMSWRLWITHSSKADPDQSRWAKRFVIGFAAFQAIWLLHLIPYVTPALSEELMRAVDWYPIYVPLAAMVYWLGINGFFLRSATKHESSKALPPELIETTREKLIQSMERDQLFLDPALNLNGLVAHTGIPQKVISSVLNQQMGKSFNEFVNDYRIGAVKRRLLDGNHHLTITGIAFECGFNSPATFQRVFKQVTGQTPTEYLSQVQKTA